MLAMPPGYRSSRRRARFVYVFFGLTAIVATAIDFHWLDGLSLLAQFRAGTADATDGAAFDSATATLYVILEIGTIACGVSWLAWLSRSVENAPALGVGIPPHGPRGAIGWWFVPFASFVVPYRIVRDLWQRLDGGSVRRAWPVLGWWLLFLAYIGSTYLGVLVRAGASIDPTVDGLRSAFSESALLELVMIVALLAAMYVCWDLERRQQAWARVAGATFRTAIDAPIDAPDDAPNA